MQGGGGYGAGPTEALQRAMGSPAVRLGRGGRALRSPPCGACTRPATPAAPSRMGAPSTSARCWRWGLPACSCRVRSLQLPGSQPATGSAAQHSHVLLIAFSGPVAGACMACDRPRLELACVRAQVRQVLTGIMGFMMYKLAVLGVTAVPATPRERRALPV